MARTTLQILASLTPLLLLGTAARGAEGAPVAAVSGPAPRVLDPRLKLELFAEQPQIVTPVGIAVDPRGRVLVVESHTHFRPAGYAGPPTDRIRRLEDTDGDGRADRITTFHEGSVHTMGLALEPDGSLLVVTRGELLRLIDTKDAGRADKQIRLARLETPADYPHNGLGGVALDAVGNIYLSMGENLGHAYKLIGSDGRMLTGAGEGGNIFRCRADGSGLERVATGFWNPFHLTCDGFGRLLAVDNDPDSRPPCRLLHIVERGDYGYRYRNGRLGLHPFTSWFGEAPGTLGLVAGTGEAPSGILVYESDHLPRDYRGDALVTTWGSHQLERFHLQPHGASFRSAAQPVIVGDEHFRPVGIALAPDGSIYFSDWVEASYALHGKGRIWRVRAATPAACNRPTLPHEALHSQHRPLREAALRQLAAQGEPGLAVLRDQLRDAKDPEVRAAALAALATAGRLDVATSKTALRDTDSRVQALAVKLAPQSALDPAPLADATASAEVRAAALCRVDGTAGRAAALRWLRSDDPFIRQAARLALARCVSNDELLGLELPAEASLRLDLALLLRDGGDPRAIARLPGLLADEDPRIRLLAVQWIGESRLKQFQPLVVARLKAGDVSGGMFAALLAALDLLDRDAPPSAFERDQEQAVARLLANPELPPAVVVRALRQLPPDHKLVSAARLAELLKQPDAEIRTEAIRLLRESQHPQRATTLFQLAADEHLPEGVRAEAVMGLSSSEPASRRLLVSLAAASPAALRDEALRTLRGATFSDDERLLLRHSAERYPASGDAFARLFTQNWKPTGRPDLRQPALWVERLSGGDAAAGQRVFFQGQGARCATCHRINDRGGRIGPDLSAVGRMGKARIIESLVQPSREIAPQYVNWSIDLNDGRTMTGVLISEQGDGQQVYADADGKLLPIHRNQIEERRPLSISLMPAGLTDLLTDAELRDLVAFLLTCH